MDKATEDGPFLSLLVRGAGGKDTEVEIEAFEIASSAFEPAKILFRPAKKAAFDATDLEKVPLEKIMELCNQSDVRRRVEEGLSFHFTSPEERRWHLRADSVGDGYVIQALVGNLDEICKAEEDRFWS